MSWAGAAIALAWLGCVPPLWELDALPASREARQELSGLAGHRLGDATPYVFASLGEATFFLCRWPSGEPIPLVLPDLADPELGRALETAVAAVEATLPIEFLRRDRLGGGGIEIRRLEPEEPGVAGVANTVANCRLDSIPITEQPTVPARLVDASIWLRVREVDALGRMLNHTPAEVAGSVVHELGHALGYQGHVRRGNSVMVRSVDHVRRLGRRLLAGQPLDDTSLKALYAVPSGTVIARRKIGRKATRWLDAMSALAIRMDLHGPRIRVGDHVARISWRDADGGTYPVYLHDVARVLRDPQRFELDPALRTRELIAGAAAASEAD